MRYMRAWSVAGKVFAFMAVMMLGGVLLSAPRTSQEFEKASKDLVAQVQSLAAMLAPGATNTIRVAKCDADELILVPEYCDKETLKTYFSGRPNTFLQEAERLSQQRQPALIWVREGHVVSINPIKFSVGMDLKLQSWPLDRSRNIRVAKESKSLNSFLSLYFLPAESQ